MAQKNEFPDALPGNIKTCCFCGLSEDDELQYGQFYEHEDIVTHYYCLLLSSNMEQKGDDDEGILGFLTIDIKKELRRGKRLLCSYCKKNGATLGCCNTRCKRIFHLPCGLREGTLHQYFGEFRSFCIRHRDGQNIDEHIKKEVKAVTSVTCYICYDEVNPHNVLQALWAPCCRKNAWFHRKCVQQLALSAGYFFKCPLCNNKEDFQKAMLECGIFIPHQDASWELVPNAYEELLHRHNRCDAPECHCPHGRHYTSQNSRWDLILCRLCGSQGIHIACGNLKWTNPTWECLECYATLHKSADDNPLVNVHIASNKMNAFPPKSEDDTESDSDVSVGGNSPIHQTVDSCIPDLLKITSIKMRPGPLSSKLRQLEEFMQRKEQNVTKYSKLEADEIATVKDNSTVSSLLAGDISAEKHKLLLDINAVVNKNLASDQVRLKSLYATPMNSNIQNGNEPDIIVLDSEDDIEEIDHSKHPVFEKEADHSKTKGNTSLSTLASARVTTDQYSELMVNNSTCVSSCSNMYSINSQRKHEPEQFNGSLSNINPSVTNAMIPEVSEVKEKPHIIEKIQVLNDPVMNLKITNVTSLTPYEFTNLYNVRRHIQTINDDNHVLRTVIRNSANCSGSISSEAQIREIAEETCSVSPTPYQDRKCQLSAAAITELTVKRKTEEVYMIDKTVFNSPTKNLLEQSKRARISNTNKESETSNENISLSIDLPGGREQYAITMESVPKMHICQSAFGTANGMRIGVPVNSKAIQERNVSIQHDANRLPISSTEDHTRQSEKCVVVSPGKTESLKTRETCCALNCMAEALKISTPTESKIQPELPVAQQENVTASSRIQKNSQPKKIAPYKTIQIPCQILDHLPKDSTSILPRGGNDTSAQASSSLSNCKTNALKHKSTHTTSNEIESDDSWLSSVCGTTSEQINKQSLANNCDGDAGSSSAAQAKPEYQATLWNSIDSTHRPQDNIHPTVNYVQARYKDHNVSYIFSDTTAIPTQLQSSNGIKTRRKYHHRSRVIPEIVCLRDLKFRVHGPDRVQMVVYDTFAVNIKLNTANVRNVQHSNDNGNILVGNKNLFHQGKSHSYFQGTQSPVRLSNSRKQRSMLYNSDLTSSQSEIFGSDISEPTLKKVKISCTANNQNGTIRKHSSSSSVSRLSKSKLIWRRSAGANVFKNKMVLLPWEKEFQLENKNGFMREATVSRYPEAKTSKNNQKKCTAQENGSRDIHSSCIKDVSQLYINSHQDLLTNEILVPNTEENGSLGLCEQEETNNFSTKDHNSIKIDNSRTSSSFKGHNENFLEGFCSNVHDGKKECHNSFTSGLPIKCYKSIKENVECMQLNYFMRDLNTKKCKTIRHDFDNVDVTSVKKQNPGFAVNPIIQKSDTCSNVPDSIKSTVNPQKIEYKNHSDPIQPFCSVKVQIDLAKIESLMNNQPKLFDKYTPMNKQTVIDEKPNDT